MHKVHSNVNCVYNMIAMLVMMAGPASLIKQRVWPEVVTGADPIGVYDEACGVHDYRYTSSKYNKQHCDDACYDNMVKGCDSIFCWDSWLEKIWLLVYHGLGPHGVLCRLWVKVLTMTLEKLTRISLKRKHAVLELNQSVLQCPMTKISCFSWRITSCLHLK